MAAEIIPATAEHAAELAPLVRQADRDEFMAASGQSPEEVLADGLALSSHIWAGLLDGRVVCMFGVAPMPGADGVGVPWMVGSERLDRCASVFLRRCRRSGMIRQMLDAYPVLMNAVDCRNTRAIAWLKWLGFSFGNPIPYGAAGLPFHVFEMRDSHV